MKHKFSNTLTNMKTRINSIIFIAWAENRESSWVHDNIITTCSFNIMMKINNKPHCFLSVLPNYIMPSQYELLTLCVGQMTTVTCACRVVFN